MKKTVRLYNILLPVWLLWIYPPMWLVILPGNLAIDCAVLILALLALGCTAKRAVAGRVWWKIWLLGFAADAVGVAWMFFGMLVGRTTGGWWEEQISWIMGSPFRTPLALVWSLLGVALAGACIYLWDRWVLRRCPELDRRSARLTALALAVFTAPWTFLIPLY